jgi:phage FluMu protein Com
VSKKNGIRCCSCGKLLAEDSQMKIGHIKITCRCGVTNTIIASVEEAGEVSPENFSKLSKEKREYRGVPKV